MNYWTFHENENRAKNESSSQSCFCFHFSPNYSYLHIWMKMEDMLSLTPYSNALDAFCFLLKFPRITTVKMKALVSQEICSKNIFSRLSMWLHLSIDYQHFSLLIFLFLFFFLVLKKWFSAACSHSQKYYTTCALS